MTGARVILALVVILAVGVLIWAFRRAKPAAATAPQSSAGMIDDSKRTTPPPFLDVLTVLPELRDQTKTTVRLHPHPADDGDVHASKMGGRFLWPADEPWPTCDEAHKHQPYVGVIQLRKADVPELGFTGDEDLFQLLWCPMDHPPNQWTRPKVVWRKSADVTKPLEEIPQARRLDRREYAQRSIENMRAGRAEDTYADYSYLPQPCRLFPERVTEYPDVMDLPRPLVDRLNQWDPDWSNDREGRKKYYRESGDGRSTGGSHLYQSELSTCPGTKVGGYVSWIQSPQVPTCACGRTMEHLLTVASGEFDRGSWRRWLAVEDRAAWEAYQARPRQGTPRPWDYGLMLGDVGSIYYFICHHCDDRPIKTVEQCS